MADGASFPLVRTLACDDPIELLPALAGMRQPFLLHSSLDDVRGRWSFFGAEPFDSYRGRNYDIAIEKWRELSGRVREESGGTTMVPFTGGVVGYWAYDFGRRLETWPELAADDLRLPDVLLGFYDVVGAFEHASRRAWLFSSGLPYDGERRRAHAQERLDAFVASLTPRMAAGTLDTRGRTEFEAHSTFEPEAYRRAVQRIQEHIGRGDIYQANLSQRWTLPLGGDDGILSDAPLDTATLMRTAVSLHVALANVAPAPFAAFVAAPDHAVVSASPERFLELRSRRIETRPIKGTRPRSGDFDEDRRLRDELQRSPKDRAENIMIVDVLRNDLGRIAEPGSVRTVRLCELEAFPQVFHLTSTVEARLRPELDAFDLLHACFPGGSITGAPKLRAIEILESIEPVRRHVYTGSVGYIDWSGDADWNIAIRTALVTPRVVHFSAGGGITSDSDPTAEHEETLHKTAGMRQALSVACGHDRDALRVVA
jgi:para-aminobenzoate synthetase component 1